MKQAPLKEFASITAGQGAPQKEEDFDSEGTPFVRAGSLEALIAGQGEECLEKVTNKAVNRCRLKLFPQGTVLFAKSGMSATKDRVYKLKRPAYVVSHLAAITPNNKLDSDYLMYFLRFFRPSRLIKDPSYPSIGLSDVERIKINELDINRQEEVAQLLRKSESVIEKRQETLRLADEFLKSAFWDMFGNPISNSKGWELVPMSEVLDVRDGTHDSPKYLNQGIPLITSKNLKQGLVDFSDINFISKEDQEKIDRRSFVDDGDILYGMIGTIGSPAIVKRNRDFCIKNVALFKFKDSKMNRHYIKMLMDDDFMTKKLLGIKRGGTQKFVSLNMLRDLSIPVPPPENQQKFADLVQKVEKYKEKLKLSETQLQNLFNSLMQRAFKGELL